MTRTALLLLVAIFPVSEVTLAIVKRSRVGSAQCEDRGSMRILWISIVLGVVLAVVAQWIPAARLPGSRHALRIAALTLLLAGLVLRWAAILTLGRLFTVDVAIQSEHAVVRTGLYRHIRHPSYSGLLTAFLGLGVFFANWISILVLLVPVTFAVWNRVVKEERAMLSFFGGEYAAYCARTRRFIPGLL